MRGGVESQNRTKHNVAGIQDTAYGDPALGAMSFVDDLVALSLRDIVGFVSNGLARSVGLKGRNRLATKTAVLLHQVDTILSHSYPTKDVDALFFHARSYGDDEGLFKLASDMYQDRKVRHVVVFNSDGRRHGGVVPGESNPGMDYYIDQLEQRSVPNILSPREPGYHTRTETDGFVEIAKEHGWRSAVVIAQPHQLLRIMLGTVTVMAKTGYWMEVYTAAPQSVQWLLVTRTNQGRQEETRIENAQRELLRIPDYQKRGHLATLEELMDYLKKREAGLLVLS